MSRDRARNLFADTTGLLAGALFLCALLYGVQSVQKSLGVDYYQFWVMSRAAATPARDTLYTVETSRQIGLEYLERARSLPESSRFREAAEWNRKTNPDVLDPISTPFYYAVIGSVATGDYDRDFLVYQTLGSVAFVLALIALCRGFGYPWVATALVAALVMVWFSPLRSDVQAANVNRLQFAGLAAVLLLLRRGDGRGAVLGGLVLALLTAFKPNLALVPVLLLASWSVDARWRDLRHGLAGLVAGTVLALLVGAWFFGSPGCWLDWVGAARKLLAKPYPIENFNVSLATLIHSKTGSNVSLWLVLAILAGYGACLWRGRRRETPSDGEAGAFFRRDVLAIGAGCIIPLLSAQVAWDHYFLLTLPLFLFFLRPESALLERVLALAALVLLAQTPLNLVVPFPTPQQVSVACAISTATLLALTLRSTSER